MLLCFFFCFFESKVSTVSIVYIVIWDYILQPIYTWYTSACHVAASIAPAVLCPALRHLAMAFRASCRFALRAARSKVAALGARPALAAAATGAVAAGYAFSKPSGCQAPTLVDVSGLTKVSKTDDVPWIQEMGSEWSKT